MASCCNLERERERETAVECYGVCYGDMGRGKIGTAGWEKIVGLKYLLKN
jgi:hypothetical protein